MLPTIAWRGRSVIMIDQRKLPGQETYVRCSTYIQVAQAIEKMVIRGAPAIGIAAAYGLALGAMALTAGTGRSLDRDFEKIYQRLERTRPTARNLFWALERMKAVYERARQHGLRAIRTALLEEAKTIEREDSETNHAIGRHGQALLRDGWTILTHCNAGGLATAEYGTALGVIRAAVAEGKRVRVFADETRPFLQGARLTVWELDKDGVPVVLITDSMAGWFLRRGDVDAVVVGADRIARNGDTANKIGTYSLAVLAKENGVPFYVAAPMSTVDPTLADGGGIPIEERSPDEVREVGGRLVTLPFIEVRNPAFDVTPAAYITAIVTERGVCRPPFEKSLRSEFGMTRSAIVAGTLCVLVGTAAMAWRSGQEEALVGYLSKDKIVALATAADGSFASFAPSSNALGTLVTLVDPVHVRMFLVASRPDDLKFAGALCRAFEATGNAALSAEFIGVAKELSEPAAIIADNGVTEVPEVIVYWLGVEVGRLHPKAGVVIEEDLAAFIQQSRAQIAQEMLLDNEFFRNTFHSDLPLECVRCHLAL
jgi:methylthioribose-1-phosphate isomerase